MKKPSKLAEKKEKEKAEMAAWRERVRDAERVDNFNRGFKSGSDLARALAVGQAFDHIMEKAVALFKSGADSEAKMLRELAKEIKSPTLGVKSTLSLAV